MVKPTSYKPKIGREYSFVIGLRDLSEALSGVPQEDVIQLQFEAFSVTTDNRIVAMNAGYHHIPEYGRGPGWSIWVRAVPRSTKGHIRAALIDDAIPRILKPWLVARADLLGRAGEDVLDLVFSPSDGTIAAQPGLKRRQLEPRLVRKKGS